MAFDWRNYRIAVADLNTIHKKNYCPLQLGSYIAYSFTDTHNLEQPLLLDPTIETDPDLLTFDHDGTVQPIFDTITDIEHIRAAVSIEIYGLNKIKFLKEGRKAKWDEINQAISDANDKYEEMVNTADNSNRFYQLHDEFFHIIEQCIKPKLLFSAQFSAVARTCLFSYNYEWIKAYI